MTTMNPEQRQAVEHDIGPMLVLAGAGSGKTTVVTHRIARLIERGTPARAILAMTFTNKAAMEMLARVTRLVGKQASEATISTFHAFGLRVLSKETKALGLRDGKFTIFDQADQASTVREIMRGIRCDRRYDVWAILGRISKAKNAFIGPDEFEARKSDEYDDIAELVYPRYVKALKSFCAFDFDDLVCEVVRLFDARPDVLERWRKRYRYLMIDEYQDTNHAQLRLVRQLGEEHRNVCVVGDDDQAIYAWRGADIHNILDFERHFERTTVVKLQKNYRSTGAILGVANAVIHGSQGRRHDKTLEATLGEGDKVQVVGTADPVVEAAFISCEMRKLIDQDGYRARDLAVLYRSNLQSEAVETALREREIPYRVVGGTQFYERKEVKDLIAYLRVALHPVDEISLRRIINYPARGVGDTSLERLATHATARDRTLWEAVLHAGEISDLPQAARNGCAALAKVIHDAAAQLTEPSCSSKVARMICEQVGLQADIAVGSGSNAVAARRSANLESFIKVLERHDENYRGTGTLEDFLRLLSLNTEPDTDDPGNVVTLTTIHGAKGLEFKAVFVAGVEEGLLPHARTLDMRATDVDPQDIEEERRLFYVAVTRARERLYLCRAKQRSARGKPMPRTPSRFLMNLPKELIEVREFTAPPPATAKETMAGLESLLAALGG